MERNCYSNSAYIRNYDEYDVDECSVDGGDEDGQNETYVDDFESYVDNNYVPAATATATPPRKTMADRRPSRLRNFIYANGQQRHKFNASTGRIICVGDDSVEVIERGNFAESATSTPKKLYRRTPLRSQSVCVPVPPFRRQYVALDDGSVTRIRPLTLRPMAGMGERNRRLPLRRSKSVLGICGNGNRRRYEGRRWQQVGHGNSNSAEDVRLDDLQPYDDETCDQQTVRLFEASPTRAPQPRQNGRIRTFARRPLDFNASFSSCKPLISSSPRRNTAVISPIKKSIHSSFEIDHSRCPTPLAEAPSTASSWTKFSMRNLPLCTLRTSAFVLFVAGTLSCLLCLHIIAQRGKSYEINLSLFAAFVSIAVGFPCFRFQQWQWLPNRNYVSGYVVLSLFSILQCAALWLLDKYPGMDRQFIDITKGALCALAALTFAVATFGVFSSCCCIYPPPDNRVTHAVQGFTV